MLDAAEAGVKRRNGLVKRLRGHILLVASEAGDVTVDCVLNEDDDGPVLVTFSFSVAQGTLARVLEVLRGWEARNDSVDVLISDGRRGAQVEIRSGNGRLVLTRCD